MNTENAEKITEYEQMLVRIVRALPVQRAAELVDFAEFLQERAEAEEAMLDQESEEEIRASEERWDALLATEESQRLLEQMADEALEEVRAGRARPMIFNDDGTIAPG